MSKSKIVTFPLTHNNGEDYIMGVPVDAISFVTPLIDNEDNPNTAKSYITFFAESVWAPQLKSSEYRTTLKQIMVNMTVEDVVHRINSL